MSTVAAYAAMSATEPLTKTTITRRDPGPHDVAIDIKFAGICHSDIHTVKAEWGQPNYPVVPGHEIAGVVTAVGSEVTKYRQGDRVGVGCFVGPEPAESLPPPYDNRLAQPYGGYISPGSTIDELRIFVSQWDTRARQNGPYRVIQFAVNPFKPWSDP